MKKSLQLRLMLLRLQPGPEAAGLVAELRLPVRLLTPAEAGKLTQA